MIQYKGYYIEEGIYGNGDCIVTYCGDDVWFENKNEAYIFIDEISEEA